MTDVNTSRDMRPFLVEVGVEEIPSQYLRDIMDNFGRLIREELNHIRIQVANLKAQATPRRLVVTAEASGVQEALRERVRGPLLANAYKDDKPTPALLGFCRRVGISSEAVDTLVEGDKTYVAANIDQPVLPLEQLIADAVERAFAAIPLARSMRWGTEDYRFIRPVRWCSLWVGNALIPMTIAGVSSSPLTYGNRTDHPDALDLYGLESHQEALSKGLVMLDPYRRKQVIETEARELARRVSGHVEYDETLLEEVTQLVEWPVPFLGRFERDLLEIPAPILVTSMRVHQRYFPVRDENGQLLPYFIGVRNGIGDDLDTVRRGNEKVLRARLQDALYFYRNDLRHRLADYRPQLDRIIFHQKLGTYGDKIGRVQALFLATQNLWPLDRVQVEYLKTAIELYKADLLTQVVQEFPELQGIMGEVYARMEGLAVEVSTAIGEQYHPAFQGDAIPSSVFGQILVLLDRLDTVLEGVAHGLKPTGSEDPFGLRRGALAIGRILAESSVWKSSASELFQLAGRILNVGEAAVRESYDLVVSRLQHYLETEQGIGVQKAQAIFGADFPWSTYARRLEFLDRILDEPEWEHVALSFKRIDRVMKGVDVPDRPPRWELDVEERVWEAVQTAMACHDSMEEWWKAIQHLSDAIDALFEAVLINDPDSKVRIRRGQLLAYARQAYNLFFDIRQISG
ncbi:MAG: glycine--tRNA ligase subunit beta [Firmicutes bacterium]|jgi:glycyl-tRNA synthetase beta chain|uniref:Glycine--tRNA ligase beta subunit n=1 Tax=Sulfobacillus benefaciens TaxID=453960 RepID=A0A2T2X7M0_9FIRM|nr:glycine--tRNA ligase subunit beta [Bacillota bacterium]MCL5013659.1 glycine--tRNA ligase subunit beta [Bacillota bacterium]PSR30448.1 MAG: glycine--tRNA ligase subunit beta [Sulfobacillus benefaciens]